MTRFIFTIVIFFILFVLEVSFIYVLPHPFSLLPLVVTGAVYGYQYVRIPQAVLWPLFHGLMLTVAGLTLVPGDVLAYAVVSLVIYLTSQRVFTHRSFYGVAATAVLAILSLGIVEVVLLFISRVWMFTELPVETFISIRLYGALLGAVLLLILFPLAARMKHFAERIFLVQTRS